MQDADIILADEPVASLDPAAADRVMKTLEKINKEDGSTVLVSLHQIEYAIKYCSRVVALKDGKLIFDGKASETNSEFFTNIRSMGRSMGERSRELCCTSITVHCLRALDSVMSVGSVCLSVGGRA